MYCVLIERESSLPTVVNINSTNYPDFIMSGRYLQEYSGTKKDCEEIELELLSDLMVTVANKEEMTI